MRNTMVQVPLKYQQKWQSYEPSLGAEVSGKIL